MVTFKSRRFCNCCRLAKCFRVGMQKALIRSDAEREARKQLVAQNREKRVQQEPPRKSSSSDLVTGIERSLEIQPNRLSLPFRFVQLICSFCQILNRDLLPSKIKLF